MPLPFFTLMDNYINDNTSLKEDLHLIVNDFFNHKEFTTSGSYEYRDKELLYKEGVLKLANSLEVVDVENKYLLFFVYKKCKDLFPPYNEDQNEFSQFIEFADSLFLQTSIYHRLRLGLTSMFIVDFYQRDNLYFMKYFSNDYRFKYELPENRASLFHEGYFYALSFMNIAPSGLYKDLLVLIETIKKDDNINYLMTNLYFSIRAKSYSEHQFGESFFQYIIKKRPVNIEILVPTISGLYNKLGTSFFEKKLKSLLENKDFEISIISGISDVRNLTEKDVKYFLTIYDERIERMQVINSQLVKLIFAVLNSKISLENHEFSKQCFSRIENLLANNREDNVINFIMRELEFIPNNHVYKTDTLKKCIGHPDFTIKGNLTIAGHLIRKANDVKLFFEILEILAEKFSYTSISQYLEISIIDLLKANLDTFEISLIDFLINNDSKKRFIGLDIFNFLTNRFTHYSFSTNILLFQPIDQYKLWVALLQKYVEPKYVIPPLIPLLQSTSEIIRESFICKLEEYSENYSGVLIEILKENMNMNNSLHRIAFERVSNYSDIFFNKNVLVKKDIKELNPLYTQNKMYSDYNKNHSRKLNKQINMGAQDSLIFNFAKKIVLAKGGGWKHENNDHISELKNFSTSFSFPRLYFIAPEIFDYTFAQELSEDWNEQTFDIVAKLLENEQ